MFGSMLKKLIGSSNDREIRKMRKTVNKINALEENLKTLSDTELKAQTPVFRERLAAGARHISNIRTHCYTSLHISTHQYTGVHISTRQYTSVHISTNQRTSLHSNTHLST